MKNILQSICIVIILAVFFPNIGFSTNQNQLVTELKVFDGDSTFQYSYLYDNHDNKVLETQYLQINNKWVYKSQNEWFYNGNKCIAQHKKVWNNNQWVISFTIDYTYINDLLDSEIHTGYNNGIATPYRKIKYEYTLQVVTKKSDFYWINSAWNLSEVNSFTNSENGKTATDTTFVYQSDSISKQLLSIFSYNSDGTLFSQLIKEKVGSSDWVNSEFVYWYYKPGSELIVSERNKKWNTETGLWENLQKAEYEYNTGNQLISETYQRWETMFWGNDIRYDYEYDTNGVKVKQTLSLPIYHQWRKAISINYSNIVDNKANLMESNLNFWGGTTGEPTNSYIPFLFNNEMVIQKGKQIEISYIESIDPQVIDENFDSGELKLAYPNPSNGIFYINTQKVEILSWIISDLNGRILKKREQAYISGIIDISDLPEGFYILCANTRDTQLTQKLIKK